MLQHEDAGVSVCRVQVGNIHNVHIGVLGKLLVVCDCLPHTCQVTVRATVWVAF